ncbi:beta-prism lectin domain-containing protein [Photobacterium damselae]|uniref:beta-prism lectin domain-containing protein n=1 Tax=Photobacterium damselae TaxID=38293 RepID=UPI0035A899E8
MKKNLYPLVIILSLSGCGGDSKSGHPDSNIKPENPNNSGTLFYAQDIIRQSAPIDLFYIDISSAIETSDGSDSSLLNVTQLNIDDNCRVISQDSKGFTINADNPKICDYKYTVGKSSVLYSSATSGDGYAKATVRAVVGNRTEKLAPISAATITNKSVTLNIIDELAKSGYELDSTSFILNSDIILPNSAKTESVAIADPGNNTINYIPGNGIPSGIERILYSYSNGTDILLGSIDIAISTDANQAPTADSMEIGKYTNPDSGETMSEIPYDKEMPIDVSSLINDPDGDSLQLIDVYGFNVNLNIPDDSNGDGNFFNDTIFTVSSKEPGYSAITYVVTDKKGGYATGVVYLTFSEPYKPIIAAGHLYLPPLVYSRAINADVNASYITGDGNTGIDGLKTATHAYWTSESLCKARGGHLATLSELEALYDNYKSGALFTDTNWPTGKYWSSTPDSTTNYWVLNTENGLTEYLAKDSYLYSTCVSDTPVGNPIGFWGFDPGTGMNYLFDARIDDSLQFYCGGVLDGIEQNGGVLVGSRGESHTPLVKLKDIGAIKVSWGKNQWVPNGSITTISFIDRSGKVIEPDPDVDRTCGDGAVGTSTDEYTVPEGREITGLKVVTDGDPNTPRVTGMEFYTSDIEEE